ncbi:hypothetical protein ACQ4PT_023822 [Festuca glaucescens]
MEDKHAHHDYGVISLDLNLEPPSSPQRLIGRNRDREEAQASYACSFCVRRFLSKQALGGHQNAHRLVRDAGTRKRKRRRQVVPSSSSTSSSPVQEPAPAVHRLHAGDRELWEAHDPFSVADAPVVDWARAWGHDDREAAAEPELDLSLKLWSG